MTTYTTVADMSALPGLFATIERREGFSTDTAKMTTCRRDESTLYVLARSNSDKGWHIIGTIGAIGLGAHLDLIAPALSSGQIGTREIDCWSPVLRPVEVMHGWIGSGGFQLASDAELEAAGIKTPKASIADPLAADLLPDEVMANGWVIPRSFNSAFGSATPRFGELFFIKDDGTKEKIGTVDMSTFREVQSEEPESQKFDCKLRVEWSPSVRESLRRCLANGGIHVPTEVVSAWSGNQCDEAHAYVQDTAKAMPEHLAHYAP